MHQATAFLVNVRMAALQGRPLLWYDRPSIGRFSKFGTSGKDVAACRFRARLTAMNGYRILVVEDDADSRDTLRRLFTHKGWIVSVAKSVTEAMAKLEQSPHYILLDLMLPDGDGEDVLRKVQEDNLPARVIVCTGTNDPVRLALVKGMDPKALFQKPLDFDEVCREFEDDTVC